MLVPRFDPDEIWRAVERHKVNVLVIIGDAMARPLIEAYREGSYDASSLLALSSSAALFSPAVKDACAAALPHAFVTEAIGSTETGFAGLGFVPGRCGAARGPTVNPGPDVIVLDQDNRPVGPGRGWAGWPGAATSRSATTRTRSRPPRCWWRWTGNGTPCPATGPGSRRTGP